MAKNKPIINIILDGLNHRIKNIGEKCLNFQKQNKNLKEQLAHKTQECEELKLQLTSLSYADTICALEIDLKHKTQECQELKFKVHDLRQLRELDREARERFVQQLDQLKAAKEQAEQKIEKIRQVCAETKDVGENINDMYTAKLSGLYLKSRQILQIIDEVE